MPPAREGPEAVSAATAGGADPFSVARLRGSMMMFGVGRVLSGVIGIAWLLTLVRAVDVAGYSGYVVLVALMEIVLLTSSGGVYAFAQRYVTEARLEHNLSALPRLIWASLGFRLATLVVAGLLLWGFAGLLGALIGQAGIAPMISMYVFVILFEGCTRYLELVFESLLEQGRAQVSVVVRNGMRLGWVSILAWGGHHVRLGDVIHVETVTALIGLAVAIMLMIRALAGWRRLAPRTERSADAFPMSRVAPFVLPLFLAQCVTQLYSPDALKLIVSRVLGVAEAAAFGFAHAMSFVLYRYLPATLLMGLVRPMLVARRARQAKDDQLIAVGNLVLKINLALLLPLAALFGVAGRTFASLASGGRYPDAATPLFLLTLLLAFTGVHVVLSALATAVEDRRAVLTGTLVSLPGVVVAIAMAPWLGVVAMVLGLWISELLWCGFTIAVLRRAGFDFRLDWNGWARFAAAAAIAACAALAVLHVVDLRPGQSLALAGLVIGVVYIGACLALRPFSATDRAMVAQILPGRLRRFVA
jgi:O-antigen/teichoic acid export membrane protein